MKEKAIRRTQKTAHHHGDLREALIQAGIEILRDNGAAGLTLRRCAARAGVSHAAPAHHFEGIEGLLTTIAARGFRIFTELLIQEREKSGDDPRKRLLAICRGYLRFSEDNGSLYNLMFSSESVNLEDADLCNASASAYQVLADGCAPFEPGLAGVAGTEIMIWSLLHGYVGLSRKARHPDNQHPIKGVSLEDILPNLELRPKAATLQNKPTQ